MISITDIHSYLWRNPIAPEPVCVARLQWAAAPDGRHEGLRALRAVLRTRLPGLPAESDDMTAAETLEWIARGLQAYYDIAPPVAGFHGEGAAVFFAAYGDGAISQMAVRRSVAMAAEAMNGAGTQAQASGIVERHLEGIEARALGAATRLTARELARRGIPWSRAASGHCQAGQGINRRLFVEDVGQHESHFATQMARNKHASLAYLGSLFVPVGQVGLARSPAEALQAAGRIGFPLTMKPVDGAQGRNVFPKVTDAQEVERIARAFAEAGQPVFMQTHFPGDDHRVLVVDGKVIAVARRRPAHVVGDGTSSVAELVERVNTDPERGPGHTRLMSNIVLDDRVRGILAAQGLEPGSVPEAGRKVRLRETANLSTGGTSLDLTDAMHPDNRRMAERAARLAGLAVMGLDYITTDIGVSWRESGGGICEINSYPGLRPHILANPDRDVLGPVVDSLMRGAGDGRIPTVMVTGTKGKTTTTKMVANILRAEGHRVGMVSTYGIFLDGEWLMKGDVAGAEAAHMVLSDPEVSAAVLETARGGILKRGIGLDRCDVAALLNLGFEQVGIDGVETLEDMREVKRKVTDTATGRVVLNLDDALVAALVDDYGAGRVTLFSAGDPARETEPLMQAGARLVRIAPGGGTIEIADASGARPVVALDEVPLTLGGRHAGHVANALAATALADGLGLAPETIAAGLRATPLPSDGDPGRTRFLARKPFTVVVELCDTPPAYTATAPSFPRRGEFGGRKFMLYTTAGNRPDSQFAESARLIGPDFDRILAFDGTYTRDKKPGELTEIMIGKFLDAGVSPESIEGVPDMDAALQRLREEIRPGDFAVIIKVEEDAAAERFYEVFEGMEFER